MSIVDLRLGPWGPVRSARRRRGPRRLNRRPIGLEVLEVRLVPATSTWSGAVDANWSTPGNWDVAPAAGNDLVFPGGAANLTNNDDLGAGMAFGSLTISGSGYSISTNNSSTVALTSIDSSPAAGSSTIDLPISLTGATVTVDNSPATLVLSGAISGSVGLTKAGAGTLELTTNNAYTGATAVNAGTLLVDGIQSDSGVTVGSGATLGGIGTVNSITATGGTVNPGDSAPGILVDDGNLTLGPSGTPTNSTFTVELDGTTAGNGSGKYSQLQAAGTIDLSGVALSGTLGSDFVQTLGSTYTILDNTGTSAIEGTFTGQPQGSVVKLSGVPFQISYTGGTNSHSVVLTELDTSTTTLSFTPLSPVFGETVGLTAVVAGPTGSATPTGMVQFFNGTTSLGTETLASGTATLNTTSLPVANNSITAQYLGSSTFAGSTSTAGVVTVAQASSAVTVTFTPSAPVFGQPVTLTAAVAAVIPGAGTPTGTVQFFNGTTSLGTKPLAGGIASLTTAALPFATNSITAQYSGDTNFTADTSPATPVPLAQPSTTTTIAASSTSLAPFESVTLTATVAVVSPGTGTPTGTVEFVSNGNSLGTATLSSGTATLTVSSLPIATNSITAVYSGDSNFSTSTSSALTISVGTPNEQWLNQVYLIALDRTPSQNEINFWNNAFDAGRTRKAIVYGISHSPEAKTVLVQNEYAQFLGVQATPEQVSSIVKAAESTHTSTQAVILGSHAFFEASGATFDGFLSGLENAVWGYGTYSPSLAIQLEQGVSRIKVAQEVLDSNASKSVMLTFGYNLVLNRDPTPQENIAGVEQMDQGIYLRTIIASLLAGNEFYSKVTTGSSS